jgi:hypothetical protein
MQLPAHRFSRVWPFLVWAAVGLILFWPVLPYYLVLPSPDSAPFYPAAFRLRHLDLLLSGDHAVAPHDLLTLLLPPLVMHDMTYLIDTLLIAAGCAYLLRGRGIPNAAAWFGGGVLAFAGYSFTLVSAGHRGFFHMGVYVIFMLAFVLRAMLHGRAVHFALAALCAGWALRFAPDFSVPYFMLAAAYALWLLLRNAAGQPWRTRLHRLAVGMPVAALCLAVTGYPSFKALTTTHLRTRESQIAQASAAQPALSGAEASAAAERDKWIFATNWSLPPEEIVESVAPCIFGTQTGDPRAPYWGRLGRTEGWERHRQGFPNFRQHTVYLGAIPLCLAALAVAFAWRLCRYRSAAESNDGRGELSAWLSDVPFWSAVAIVALLLAFGRHAPFYRLFYSLPYMSLLRAPVKFVRFVELAVAVLAATGLATLLSQGAERSRRRVSAEVGIAVSLAVLTAVVSIHVLSSPNWLANALDAFGASAYAPQFARGMCRALMHAVLGLIVFAAFLLCRHRKWLGPGTIAALLTVYVGIDSSLVDRRFIAARDLSSFYRDNLITRTVLDTMKHGAAIANHATPSTTHHWLSGSLHYAGIRRVEAIPEAQLREMMNLAKGDLVRFWEVGGAGFALIPATWSRRVARDRCEHVAWLRIGDGTVSEVQPAEDGTELLRVKRPLPYAYLSPSWRMVADETAARAALFKNVSEGRQEAILIGTPLPAPPAAWRAGTVTVKSSRFRDGALATRLEVVADTPQVLTVREVAPPLPAVFLDGRRQTSVSSPLGVAIYVPAGKHTLVLRSAWTSRGKAAVGAAGILALLTAICFVRRASGATDSGGGVPAREKA